MSRKFLKISGVPVTGNVLIGIDGIKTITTATAVAVTTVIAYNDGTATTITTAAQVGADVYLEVLAAVENHLAKGNDSVIREVTLPKAITSIANA